MQECGYIIPRQRESVGPREDYYIAECVLAEGHEGPHLVKTPEGKFIGWEFDEECHCEDCLDYSDSNNRCYIYWKVSDENAQALLNRK